MDDGRIVHTGAMAALAADEALQQRLLGLGLGERTSDAPPARRTLPAAAPYPLVLPRARAGGAAADGVRRAG